MTRPDLRHSRLPGRPIVEEPGVVALAVDIGGSRLRAAQVTHSGQVEVSIKINTPGGGHPDAVVASIHRLIDRLRGLPGDRRYVGVGVGVPGPMDPHSGRVFEPPNLAGWRDFPLATRLRDRLSLPVWLHNDANLAALGEARLGAGSGFDPLLYLTISTGIGGGIVSDGRIYEGARGLAGECGHVIVQAGGPRCKAGHAGCAEALASGTAIAARAAELITTQTPGSGLAAFLAPGVAPSARDVARAAAGGDVASQQLLAEAGEALGLAIGSLINVLDPARVVLGGGLVGAWEHWAPAMEKAVAATVMAGPERSLSIVPALLGDDAGLVGAALYAFDQAQC